jgi:hypothetical protein
LIEDFLTVSFRSFVAGRMKKREAPLGFHIPYPIRKAGLAKR